MVKQKKPKEYDYVILGAGIFGLYAASILGRNKEAQIAIIEKDKKVFSRASKINQARVHNGYHYPRSVETASKAACYYERFKSEFEFAINGKFKKIYAISSDYSRVNSQEFHDFCKNIKIPAKKIDKDIYFNSNMVEDAFETEEVGFDYKQLSDYLFLKVSARKNVNIYTNRYPKAIKNSNDKYMLELNDGTLISSPVIINSTYASTNQILNLLNLDKFSIKYELCEIILCKPSRELRDLGITIMDGPFFSIMPFGNSRYHTLTSVSCTPHLVSYENLPIFSCQKENRNCTFDFLKNCNDCKHHPKSAWEKMYSLFRGYMKKEYDASFVSSMYAVKPILLSSEMDDSRPTIIKKHTDKPQFISIFSGKISSIFDLEKYFNN